ncbi:hypothetical protein ABEB36_000319 [Hypothenemus hampei]|uniref:Protein farnesyltransferase/geranylgeranyltransferase type-1 subunit alpha n=1 Tax=Hypothenemus hampei TaxID=57062 RepID=A0ABD1FE05_HYPHA
MADSSDDEVPKHVLFKDRPEWKDIEPLGEYDSDEEQPVVNIEYSAEFKDCYDYFRAVAQKREYTQRVLDLTDTAIKFNPANYTIWGYRFDTLKALEKDLRPELEYTKRIILKQPKNYQVWNYRNLIVTELQDASNEKELTALALAEDSKNYHAWDYRISILRDFKMYDGELEFATQMIEDDVRNNSAWNYRDFVIHRTNNFWDGVETDVIKSEIEYTLDKITKLMDNESAWSYLRGILANISGGICGSKRVNDFCHNLYYNKGNRCRFLLSFMLDCCFRDHEVTYRTKEGDERGPQLLARIKELCLELATEHDVTRKQYWMHLSKSFEKMIIKAELERQLYPSSEDEDSTCSCSTED